MRRDRSLEHFCVWLGGFAASAALLCAPAFAGPTKFQSTGPNQQIALELSEGKHGDLTVQDREVLAGLEAGRTALLIELNKRYMMRNRVGTLSASQVADFFNGKLLPLPEWQIPHVDIEDLQYGTWNIIHNTAGRDDAYRLGVLLSSQDVLEKLRPYSTPIPPWPENARWTGKAAIVGGLFALALKFVIGADAHDVDLIAGLSGLTAAATLAMRAIQRLAYWSMPHSLKRYYIQRLEIMYSEVEGLKKKLCAGKLEARVER